MVRGDDLRRFATKTMRDGECILWIGGADPGGYGKFSTKRDGERQKHFRAHRWIYEQVIGEKPPLLRHKCDNPRCVRVDHLEPGSQADNVHDAMDRGRREQSLTPDLVRRVRAVYESGQSLRAEAAVLGVNYSTAYQAATRRSWRHVA